MSGAGGSGSRGKGKGSTANQEELQQAAGQFAQLYAALFALLARLRGEHWRIAEQEAGALGVSTAGVLPFLPVPRKDLGKAMAFVGLGLTASVVVLPRVAADIQERRARNVNPITRQPYPTERPNVPLWSDGQRENNARPASPLVSD